MQAIEHIELGLVIGLRLQEFKFPDVNLIANWYYVTTSADVIVSFCLKDVQHMAYVAPLDTVVWCICYCSTFHDIICFCFKQPNASNSGNF